jgi:hypothetical protein
VRRVLEGHRPPRRPTSSTVECRGDDHSSWAAAFFGGNIEASRSFLDEYGYNKKAISKSRFNRRLHAIDPSLWRTLFDGLAEVFKHEEYSEQTYVVDSLPVAVCDKSSESTALKALSSRRTRRSLPWLLIVNKHRYFYGLRVHLVVSGKGEPVEFSLAAASEADVKLLKELGLDLPEGSIIHADKGYTDYHYEDLSKRGWPAPQSAAQEEIQAANAFVGGVSEQARSPVHRNGFQ